MTKAQDAECNSAWCQIGSVEGRETRNRRDLGEFAMQRAWRAEAALCWTKASGTSGLGRCSSLLVSSFLFFLFVGDLFPQLIPPPLAG